MEIVDESPTLASALVKLLIDMDVRTEFQPPIESIRLRRLPCLLHNGPAKGRVGHVILLQVARSDRVHSIVNSGTFTRLDAGNRQMTASEVTELSYRRGVRSASGEPVSISLERIQTETWKRFVAARGLRTGTLADQLLRIGLAVAIHTTATRWPNNWSRPRA